MEFIDFNSRWQLPPFRVVGAPLLSAAWLSLGFFLTPATGPVKHTKEPPGHGLDPANHDSTHDAIADTTQSPPTSHSTRTKSSQQHASNSTTTQPRRAVPYVDISPWWFAASSSAYDLSGNTHTPNTYDSVLLRGDNNRVDWLGCWSVIN